jgi:hypothetical protein
VAGAKALARRHVLPATSQLGQAIAVRSLSEVSMLLPFRHSDSRLVFFGELR